MSEVESEYGKKRRGKGLSSLQLAAEIGKVPPQAVDLEEAVLGALCLEKKALNEVIGFLRAESFYKEPHQHIYQAIIDLVTLRQPVDILTVTQQLRKNGVLDLAGGPYYISQLTDKVASAANIEFHAKIVQQKFIGRELIRISTETIKLAYEDTTDVLKLTDSCQQQLFTLNGVSNAGKEGQHIAVYAEKELQAIETASKLDKPDIGISTGFEDIDTVIYGLSGGLLYLLAARPGMGKSTLALQVARNAAAAGKPSAFFSLEMPAAKLILKLISLETGISQDRIQKKNLNQSELLQVHAKVAELKSIPLYIDDSSGITPFEFESKLRRMKKDHRIELAVADYLQLMNGFQKDRKHDNKNDEVGFISSNLKGVAKELDIPVIALSQLNRDVEKRQNKEPMLSDLRDSGSLEQDADVVLFLYRPGYYKIYNNQAGDDIRDLCKVIVAKNRYGELKDVMLRFKGEESKFMGWSRNADLKI
jgi:replicative DNA helicase